MRYCKSNKNKNVLEKMYMKNKYQKSLLWEDLSGHLSNIHQPRLSEIMEFQLPFEVRSCGASII